MFNRKKKELTQTEGIEPIPVREKELAAAVEKAAVVDAIPDAVIMLNLDGEIIALNPAYTRMFGWKPEDRIGKSFTEFKSLKAEDVERFIKLLGQLIEIGCGEPLETLTRTKDDREIPISVSYALVKDAEGNPKNIIAVIRDITELKRAEEDRLKAETSIMQERASVIDAMPDSVVVINLDGELIYVNPAHLKMFGHKSADEILGVAFEGFKERLTDPEKDIPRFLGLFKEVIEKGYTEKPIELILRKVDGKEFFVSASANLLRDAEGNPKNVVAILRDITELQRVQDEVVAARDYTENIIESMIDTLIVVDPDARIRTINQATSDLLGYREEELIGKPAATIFAEEEEEEEEEEVSIFKGTRLKKLVEEGTIRDYDMKYRTKKGEVIPVSFSGSVMRGKDGNLIGIVGIARDMREIKRLMQKEKELAAAAEKSKTAKTLEKRLTELQQAYIELQDSKDALVRSEKLAYTGRIAASIAHEIRNPLTNVSMSIQQLKKGNKITQEGFKHIKIVERNIERINYLITELLNCARPAKLNLQPYHIHKVVNEVLESYKTKIDLQRIKVIKNFCSKLPVLKIDKEQIERAFLNLISNAIEAMPRGGDLTINTELDGNFFLAKIRDTGKGIPEEDIIKIFDPFFSTKTQGVGLGLTICYGIIVSHGGTIEVDSKFEKGSLFTVSLPIEQRPTERESK